MIPPLLMLLATLQQATTARHPATITRDIQRAREQGSAFDQIERQWQTSLARDGSDRRALLALGAIARLRYQYERADSHYARVVTQHGAKPDGFDAAAHIGLATWRSLGSDLRGADSLFSLAREEARAAEDSRLEFEALMGLSRIRGRTFGPKIGLQLVREARAAAKSPSTEDLANITCAEGALLGLLGDTTAKRLISKGSRLAERAGSLRAQAACDLQMAQTVERGGAFGLASGLASNAVRRFEQAHDEIGVALASQWVGYVRFRNHNFTQARADLERAVRASRATRYRRVEAWALSGLAELFVSVGDLTSAQEFATHAARLHTEHRDLWGLAVAYTLEGRALEAQLFFTEAREKYTAAVQTMRRAGLPYNTLEALRLKALIDMRLGAVDSAERTFDEATTLARSSANSGWLHEVTVHRGRLAMLRGDLFTADSLLSAVRAVYEWRQGSDYWTHVQYALFEAQLALRLQRAAVAESAITYVAATIARWRQRVRDGAVRVGLARMNIGWTSLGDAYPDLVSQLVTANRLPVALRLVESVRARELTEIASGAVKRQAGPRDVAAPVADVTAIQHALRADEAFISLTLGLSGAPTTAIVVTVDSAFARSLPGREVLAPMVERYQRVAAAGSEPIATGQALGAALLDPIVRALPARITRLLISPDGDLFRVPFDALRLTGDRYAVERFSIAVVPSATVALLLRQFEPSTRLTRFIAVGDPAFAAQVQDDRSRFRDVSLARLPHSASEAKRVAQYGLRGLVWTGKSASEATVRQTDWRDVAVAHFATHALIDNHGQAGSALALATTPAHDGFLTAGEITTLRFNGALVTLSACQSLGGQVLSGEGLRGLVGPLLESGARGVVASLWSIGDRSTLPFMDRFYAAIAAGENVGDALRSAKLAALKDGAPVSDWAAFTVIGDATMRPPLKPRRLSALESAVRRYVAGSRN